MKVIVPIKRGEPITAKYLGALAENSNELQRAVAKAQADAALRVTVPNADKSNADPNSLVDQQRRASAGLDQVAADDTWRELSRTTSTVRVENPSDPAQYVDVERIDAMVLINGAGKLMALQFTNT